MRDLIKNQKYWDQFIEKKVQDLSEIDEIVAANGLNEENMEQTVKFIEYERLCLAIAMYSAGMDIDLCKEPFMKSLNNLSERKWKLEIYVDIVWYVSLSVLFNLGEEAYNKLLDIMPESLLDDKIIAPMMGYLGNVDLKGKTFAMVDPYGHLDELFVNSSPSQADIHTYLSKYWYKGHNEEAWYNSHKSKNLYFGYWSFESAALAKVLKIDDSELCNEKYYPYDLAHYA